MDSSFPAVVAAVEPELTDRAVAVVPVASAIWSTAPAPAAAERPEYSSTAMPISAVADGFAMMVGLVPPLWVTGAVHTLSCAPSEAVAVVSSVKESPAESVTLEVVAWPELQSATSTTRRFPVVTLAGIVTEMLVLAGPCALTCCTNAGATAAVGVTGCDGDDAGPVPTVFAADTVKV
jgi:hypothetical protein